MSRDLHDLRHAACLIINCCERIADFRTNGGLRGYIVHFYDATDCSTNDGIKRGVEYLLELHILEEDHANPERLKRGNKWDDRTMLLAEPYPWRQKGIT